MATLSIKNIAHAIYESSKDKDDNELNVLTKNIVNFLNKKRMMSKANKIIDELEGIVDDNEKIKRVKITSKNKLSNKLLEEIREFIKKKYRAKNVIFQISENEKLLGGIKIEIENDKIDTTLLNKIKKLQTYLIKN